MARKRKVYAPVNPIDRSHIVEDDSRAGEVVGIAGRRGAFRILREAMNVKLETEWVELIGPLGSDRAFTAVRPDRITKRRSRGR